MLKTLERDRWFALLLLAGLAVLCYQVIRSFGVDLPEFPRMASRAGGGAMTLPPGRLDRLMAPGEVPQLGTVTNLPDPFFTAHFRPVTPPAPTTRRVELTYLGHYQGSSGPGRAFIQVDDKLFVGPVGSNVVSDLTLAEIRLKSVVLRNKAGQTNQVEFNVKKGLDVPTP
jgi:hypothetical protein